MKIKPKPFQWTLLIEFNGLCAAEVLKPPKGKKKNEMIVHFVNDSMHRPVLAVRDRDVVAAHDCRPAYKVLARGETPLDDPKPCHEKDGIPTTLALWPTVRGAHQSVMNVNRWALDVDTTPPKLDGSKPPKPTNPGSIRWLPTLGDILGSNDCDPLHDFSQFRLTDGVVVPGRLNPARTWEVSVSTPNGPYVVRKGPLAVTIIYMLVVKNIPVVVLDLHPGMLSVGPHPDILKDLIKGKLKHYCVETTISSLPVAHHEAPILDEHGHHDANPHFDEYNRLVGTNKTVTIREVVKATVTVEDPIHCFDAAVVP